MGHFFNFISQPFLHIHHQSKALAQQNFCNFIFILKSPSLIFNFQILMQKQKMESQQILITPLVPQLNSSEQNVLITLLSASAHISRFLRSSPTVVLQTSNAFGDQQLHQDVYCDQLVQKYLRANPSIKGFASQQRPQFITIKQQKQFDQKYIVTYDPIDGSSIIDTNFSVGSIFSVWEFKDNQQNPLIGRCLNEQVCSLLVVYGSRTTALLYNSQAKCVQEYTLIEKYSHDFIKKDEWICSRKQLKIAPKTKMFSPGNLRAVTEHNAYNQAVTKWISKGYTLRYTGGLVPDIYQILIKGHGIFSNIVSSKHNAKLRVLYQVAAVAFLVEKAQGKCVACKASKGQKVNRCNVMDVKVQSFDQRMGFVAGSAEEVQELVKNGCLDGI